MTKLKYVMKALLKSILPQSAINARRMLRDKRGLMNVHPRDVNTDVFPTAIDVGAYFADPKIDKSWNDAHSIISHVTGAENRFDGVNPGDRQAIYKLIAGLKPKSILEIGTHIGFSTLHMAMAAKTYGDDFKITTVDIEDVNAPNAAWAHCGLQDSPWALAEDLNCAWNIEFVKSDAQSFMVRKDIEKFDFIFLDGDHSSAGVYNEIALASQILNENGVILLHDYYPNAAPLFPDGSIIYGPYYAGERLRSESSTFDIMPLGNLPWKTKQESHKTSLATVLKIK